MRKVKKKCCAIGLSLALAVSTIWQGIPVLADEYSVGTNSQEQKQEKEKSDLEISSKAINSYRDIDQTPPVSVKEYEKSHFPQDVTAGLEAKYNPVHDGSGELNTSLPAVRNQNPFGTCWAHSVMSMIEMNLYKKGILSENMSEFQSIFFMNHDWTDPLGLCSGDNFHTVDEDATALSSTWYTNGNNTAYTKFMLMDWVGAVSEYDYTDTQYDVLVNEKGDAYLDDSYAINKDKVHVQSVNVINAGDADVVKQMIKDYGAVGISYFEDKTYYNADSQSYYNPYDKITNHAVALVGWDDNFDKSNFNIEPSENGAWLVRNSWGAEWGKDGYFWISYYDTSLDSLAYSLDVAYKSEDIKHDNYYDNNYQYDGGIGTDAIADEAATSLPTEEANVFTAKGKEELKAVAIYTGANYEYDIKVYTGLKDKSDPASGALAASISGTQTYEGYHTVELPDSVMLNQGDVFSIVVTLTNNNNDYTFLAIDTTLDKRLNAAYPDWIYSKSEAQEGQSFFRCAGDNRWTDMMELKDSFGEANLRIKAYTNNNIENPIESIQVNDESVTMNIGNTYNFAANMTVLPANYDETIIYSSNNKDVATVDDNGLITAVHTGDAVITATARSNNVMADITVHVVTSGKPAESITLSVEKLTLTEGDTEKIDATLTPADSDDKITWSSSASEIANVDADGNVTGVSKGAATISAITASGKSASCAVKVKKKRGEIISCVYNKLPKKIYKFNTYKISLSAAMNKLSPTKIDWALNLGNKDNIVLTPVGENGKDGCELYVKQVASARNRGEKLRLDATVTYIKTTRKGQTEKTRKYKRRTTSYNLSYELELDTEDITFTKKGDTIPLSVIFNEGEEQDQPTNTKIKWMVTDATGKKDNKGKRVISVNSKGVIKSKAPGVTYVTAFAADSYVKASRSYAVSDTIKVTCVPVTSVSFNETSLSLAKLSTTDLKAKLIFNNGTEEPFNKDGMKLKWVSSNKKIVSVNSKGVAKVTNKANAGETCKITVQATGGVPAGQTAPEATIDIVVQ